MKLNREKIQRMFNDRVGGSGSGSGGSGGDMPAGIATQAWTMENFLSIEFFTKLFKAYGPAETEGDPDVEIVPNDVEGEISNIKAMFGFWTEQYVSALGQGSGGGGGGGDLNEPLASINTAGLATHPGSAGQTIVWNGSAWVYGSVLNQGVTSVGLSAPTGFNVTGSPITTSGTLALSFASGYELPLAADTAKGVTAYGWGDHSLAGYALASNVYSKTDADAKFLTIAFFRSLFKAYTSASAEVVPNAGDTTTISSIKAMFGFWTDQYISALGQGSGGGGGITLNEPLASLNNAGLSAPSSAGQTLVWNGSAWKYSSTAGISTTSMNVGGSASISGALSVAGNITTSAGGFIVSSKDNTYVLLAGGGTKLLSEIGGGGAVNSITIGSGGTNYTPDANGIVTIPPYPSTANLVSGITVNGGTYTPSSGIVVLPAYPTVPTNISSFTNDSGYITNAALTGYLPLTGGTMTGTINSSVSSLVLAKYYNNVAKMYLGYTNSGGYSYWSNETNKYEIRIMDNGDLKYAKYDTTGSEWNIWHSGNFSPSDYLPLTGGSLANTTAVYTSAILNITNNATHAGQRALQIFIPNAGSLGGNNIRCTPLLMGKSTDMNNMCDIDFYYIGAGSTNNAMSFGFYANDDLLYIRADGHVGIGTTAPNTKLHIYQASGTEEALIHLVQGNKTVSCIYYQPAGYNGWSSGASGDTYFFYSLTTASTAAYISNTGTITAGAFVKSSGTSSQFLKADGSVDSNTYALNSSLSSYLPLSGGTMTGTINSSVSSTVLAKLYNNVAKMYLGYTQGSGYSYWSNETNCYEIRIMDNGDLKYAKYNTTGAVWDIWHSGNFSPSDYVTIATDQTITGTKTFSKTAASASDSIVYISNTINTAWSRALDIEFPNLSGSKFISPFLLGKANSNYNKGVIDFYYSGNGSTSNGMGFSLYGFSDMLFIQGTGNVGIGTTSPSYKLDVQGVIYSSTGVYSAGYVTALSDARRKDVQGDVMLTAEDVANAPMIKFLWKDRANDGMQVGSIAQYWQRYLPEAIVEDKDGYLTMDYGIIALLSSIATARKVKDHERRIAELERENNELKKRLNAA